MRIDRFDLSAFGKFTNVTLDFAGPESNFHIIYGPNEAGKSTSLRAIAAWLFGFEKQSNDNYVHAYSDMRVGGKISSPRYGTLECVRRKGTKRTLISPDGSEEADESLLVRMLGGVDQDTFLRGLGLDRERLIAGGKEITSGEGELGSILFSAGLGVTGLNDLADSLEKEKREIFLSGGSLPALNRTLAEIRTVQKELNNTLVTAAELNRRRELVETVRAKVDQLAGQRNDLQRQLNRSQLLKKSIPFVRRRRELLDAALELRTIPDVDEEFSVRRRDAEAQLHVTDEQLRILNLRQQQLTQAADLLPETLAIFEYAERIEDLAQQVAVAVSHKKRLSELVNQHKRLSTEIAALVAQLDDPKAEITHISGTVRETIQHLSEDRLRLDQELSSKQEKLKLLRKEISELQAHQEFTITDNVAELELAIKGYPDPHTIKNEYNVSIAQVTKWSQKCTVAFQRLGDYVPSFEAALQLRLPPTSEIELAGQEYERTAVILADQTAQLDSVKRQFADLLAELKGIDQVVPVASESQLHEMRRDRDAALERIARHVDEDHQVDFDAGKAAAGVQQLAESIRACDQAVDQIRRNADLVLRRLHVEAESVRVKDQLSRTEEDVCKACELHDVAERKWRQLWNQINIQPGPPKVMSQWLERYDAFLETIASEREEQARLTVARKRYDECLMALKSAITSVGEDAMVDHERYDATFDLVVLHTRVAQMLDQYMTASRAAERIQQDAERTAREFRVLQEDIETLEVAQRNWHIAWQTGIKEVTTDANATPARVQQLITCIDGIVERRERLGECEEERARIENESHLLELAARSVAGDLKIGFDEQISIEQLVKHLVQMLKEARAKHAERESMLERLKECRDEIEGLSRKKLKYQAVLKTMSRELGCTEVAELPEIERQARRKAEILSELKQIDQTLRDLATGQELEDFEQEVLRGNVQELDEVIFHCEGQLKDTQDAWEAAQREVGACQRSLEDLDGSGKGAELNQQIQSLEAKAARLARRYAVVAIERAVLMKAIENYREQNQGPILQRGAQIFRRLTRGSYIALRPILDEKDNKVLVGIRREGDKEYEVKANLMSEGTADALFLALRLAGLEGHVRQHGPVPLIIDDVLVQFDDERAAAALTVLYEFSQMTQVIFFTHHRHVVDLVHQHLETGTYKVHDLCTLVA